MKQTIGEFLATQRKAKGYTQQYVADILGVSNRTLSAWETNKAYPDILTLPALAELYGVTVDEILGGERNTAELQTEEISQKAQNGLYKNRLAQYSSKNTAFIVTGVCGAVAVTFGLIFLFVIGWLGLTLIVLGTLASIVAITFLVAYSKNAVTSAGIFTFDQNLSKANKSFILNIAIMRSRILNLLGFVWLGCAAIITVFFLIWQIGVLVLIPFIAAALLFTAAVTDRNTAIKRYGTEENKTVLKRNSKLLAKCIGFSCIPAAVIIVAFTVLTAVASSSYIVLYEGEEKDFRQYMHTLQQFSVNSIYPDFVDDYNELIPDPVVLEIPEEIKSGEYIPVYKDLIYINEFGSELDIYFRYEITDESVEGVETVKYDYFYLCRAERLTVKDSDILVYNIRFTDGVNYGEIRAEHKDGVYTVLGKNGYTLVLTSVILFAVLAATGPVAGTTIYFCKRDKQRFSLEA